jgi:hypothetical protein
VQGRDRHTCDVMNLFGREHLTTLGKGLCHWYLAEIAGFLVIYPAHCGDAFTVSSYPHHHCA